MNQADFVSQAISTWRVNNRTNLVLLEGVSPKGLLLQPNGPRARNIAQVFAHLHHCRIGWVRWQDPSAISGMKRFTQGSVPSRMELKRALKSSAGMVQSFMERAFEGQAKIKSFKKQPVRFISYLIMHEAHHRGQIIYALKRADMKLPQKTANHLWADWIWGKE